MFCLHEEEKQDFYSEPNTQETQKIQNHHLPHKYIILLKRGFLFFVFLGGHYPKGMNKSQRKGVKNVCVSERSVKSQKMCLLVLQRAAER